jgi:hypothetical protein
VFSHERAPNQSTWIGGTLAENKPKRSSHLHQFSEVKGKTVEAVELDADATAIVILFQDNTALSFDLDPGLSVFPELRKRGKGDWRKIKRWSPIHSSPSVVKW